MISPCPRCALVGAAVLNPTISSKTIRPQRWAAADCRNSLPLPLARCDPPLLVGADAGARLWRRLRAAAEQPVEEGPPKKLSPPRCRRCRAASGPAPRRALRPVDGDVGHLALGALQDRQQALVAAVDVVADLQLAGIVHERGLVGEVDRDAGREVDVDLRRRRTSCAAAPRCSARSAAPAPSSTSPYFSGFSTRMQPWL